MSCLALLLAAADRGIFELDVVTWPIAEAYDALAAQGPLPVEYRNRLEVGGVKRILDGSPQGKTAYFRDPYFVPLDGRGPKPQATGNRHADIPQNSGAPAHLAVFHVHFPIILKFGDAGAGTGWKKGSPAVGEAVES